MKLIKTQDSSIQLAILRQDLTALSYRYDRDSLTCVWSPCSQNDLVKTPTTNTTGAEGRAQQFVLYWRGQPESLDSLETIRPWPRQYSVSRVSRLSAQVGVSLVCAGSYPGLTNARSATTDGDARRIARCSPIEGLFATRGCHATCSGEARVCQLTDDDTGEVAPLLAASLAELWSGEGSNTSPGVLPTDCLSMLDMARNGPPSPFRGLSDLASKLP